MSRTVYAAALAAATLLPRPAAAQPTYSVTRIVVPAAPFGSTPVALSQEGWVIGRYAL